MNEQEAAVQKLIQGYFPAFVRDLEEITNIDSGHGDPEGTEAVAKIVAGKLEALGGKTEFRRNDKATHTIVRFAGKGGIKILMIAHVDTVFAKGEAAKRPFRMDEKRFAYGPGVGDDKATIIQTIYAMKALKDLSFDQYGEIVLYYNGEEEGGSPTAEAIVAELSAQADVAVIMDTARPDWGIVTQRKGSANYEIKVAGIEGHHGNASQSSASAVMALGCVIHELYHLASPLPGDPADYTYARLKEQDIVDHGQFIPENTINVGVIGTNNRQINVIPKDAFASLNVRCFTVAEQQRLDMAIKALADKTFVPGTRVSVTGGIKTGPMEKTEQVQRLVDLYKSIVKSNYGAEVVEWVAGGLTDGNRSAKFVPTIDALGVENYDEHTDHESVDLNSAIPRTAALTLFLKEMARCWPL